MLIHQQEEPQDDFAYEPQASDDLAASIESTVSHIRRLRAKEVKLLEARAAAESQVFHALGSAYRSGEISFRELYRYFLEFRVMDFPGQGGRWSRHVGISTVDMMVRGRWIPNGPSGTWVGEWPICRDDSAPKDGQAVAYILFGPDNEPCYVGSTGKLRQRMRRHEKDGKEFTRWQAFPAANRTLAYRLEDRMLREHMPRLNNKPWA